MAASAELLRKLQIKAGARLWMINVPRAIAEALTAGAEVQPVKHGEPYDGVLAFCENPTEVSAFTAEVLPELPDDGLLWFAYRKGAAAKASGLSRDVGWEALEAAGYRAIRAIAFDDEWSGLRFRPAEKVASR
jgi:hypothetical protein